MSGVSRPTPTRGIVEGALISVIVVLLVVVTFYIPLSGLLFSFFWPAPIALLYLRYDSRVAILTVVVSAIILALAVGPVDALDVAFLYGPLGLALGFAAKRRWTAGRTLALGAGAIACAIAGTIASYWLLAGLPPGTWLSQDAGTFVESLRAAAESNPLVTGWAQTISAVLAQIPWIMLAFTGALALIADYLATRALFVRLGYSLPGLTRFGDWRFPAWLRVAAAAASLVWLGRAWLPAGLSVSIVTGVLPFAVGVLIIQGLAIVDHILGARGVSGLMRIVFYLLLLTFGATWWLLAATAVADIVFDLRRRLPAPAEPAATGEKEDARESHPDAGHQDARKKGRRRRGR